MDQINFTQKHIQEKILQDAVPGIVLRMIELLKARDYEHMVEPEEETVERLKMRNKWIEEDYDPTLWSNRGAGRMVLVGYRRRKASEHLNTCSIHICQISSK